MDKKIGLVTWWQYANYGGILQAYALQKILESWGYDSEFVNFSPERKGFLYNLSRLVKNIIIFACKPRLYQAREKHRRFVNNRLKVSFPYLTYAQLRDVARRKYSAAICGSDQIWSNVGGVVNPLHYLTFIDEKKRIAYAPSIGYDYVRADVVDDFRKYVADIPFLSIRERQGAMLIEEIVGRKAKVVLDPSLLFTKERWKTEIFPIAKGCPEREYIFIYFLRGNPEYIEYAYRLSNYTGCQVVAMQPLSRKFFLPRSIKKIAADPFDFVRLIYNASFILTDSFHGTAFSINLGKQFGVFRRFADNDSISQNSRIYNILEKTHLESRLITSETPPSLFTTKNIDYNLVNPLLDVERAQSLTYLRHAIIAAVGS